MDDNANAIWGVIWSWAIVLTISGVGCAINEFVMWIRRKYGKNVPEPDTSGENVTSDAGAENHGE